MKTFDKSNLATLRIAITEALNEVGAEHGVALNIGNISYQADSFTTKVSARLVSAGAVAGQRVFDSISSVSIENGFGKAVLGDKDKNTAFKMQGRNFTIVGAEKKNWKKPILARGEDGKLYKFQIEQVARALGRKVPNAFGMEI